jgi:hypothetical protein
MPQSDHPGIAALFPAAAPGAKQEQVTGCGITAVLPIRNCTGYAGEVRVKNDLRSSRTLLLSRLRREIGVVAAVAGPPVFSGWAINRWEKYCRNHISLCIFPPFFPSGPGRVVSPERKKMHTRHLTLVIAALIAIIALGTAPVSAASFKHNDTVWTSHAAMIIDNDTRSSIYYAAHHRMMFEIYINPHAETEVIIPLTSSSKRDGTNPKIQNLTFDITLPAGVNITQVEVYSGTSLIYSRHVEWGGSGDIGTRRTLLFSMGSPRYVANGLTAMLRIENKVGYTKGVYLNGAAATLMW